MCHNHDVVNAGLRALVEAMQGGAPCNETLESLSFHGCDIGWEDGAKVYLEAWDQGCLPRVETHGLAVNPIGLDGIRALCRMYAEGKLRRKHEMRIDIGNTSGVDALLDVIRQDQAPGMWRIVSYSSRSNNHCLEMGLAALGKAHLLLKCGAE